MRLFNFFKKKEIAVIKYFFTLYIATNMIGGERGLISYYEKKKNKKFN